MNLMSLKKKKEEEKDLYTLINDKHTTELLEI